MITQSSTPDSENNIKVEVLDKTKDDFGNKYLKCKITNLGEEVVKMQSVSLSFYQDDVKIKDAYANLKLKYLKPNQSIPVWVNIYGVDKYTSVKPKETTLAPHFDKISEQIYPTLKFTQTEMKSEMGTLSYNFRNYRKLYYKVSGIVENQDYEEISPEIFVLFYDENSEIIGIESTRVNDLKKDEKAKFEVSEIETDLFGKPKTFELIAISDR